MRGPMLVLAAACVAIGLAPAFFGRAVRSAAAAWRPDDGEMQVLQRATGPEGLLAKLGAYHVAIAAVAIVAVLALRRRVRANGVARAGTWDCGYAAPTARMQYTAGSFAEIVTGWFAWILRPVRHVTAVSGFFPRGAKHEVHTPETVLERVVEPAGAAVLSAASGARKLQHGRLQFYILYLVAGIVVLGLLVLGGGR
jgi:hydrogenase-4 component B